MNKNFLFSGFISVSLHALLLVAPFHSIFIRNIDIDIVKAPASIEISLVNSMPSVEVKARKIGKIPLKKLEEKKETKESKKNKIEKRINTKPITGAITEQISSLMINKPPVYPTVARVKGWEGEVVLIASINKSGQVTSVNVLSSSGFYMLDRAAQKAINQWRFRNIAKSTEVEIPVKFILTNK